MFTNLLNLLRHLAFIVVVYGMVIQPVTQTFAFFSQADQELADTDIEENTNEKEKQEEDSKDEKIDSRNVSLNENHLAYYERSSHYGEQGRIRDFSPEIPIPPPERT